MRVKETAFPWRLWPVCLMGCEVDTHTYTHTLPTSLPDVGNTVASDRHSSWIYSDGTGRNSERRD